MKTKFPREQALGVAKQLCDTLKPVTSRLIVAGSLRRGKAEVGDVEILFIPKVEPRPDPEDLLGNLVETNLALAEIDALLKSGVISKRPNCDGHFAWGASNRLAVHVASGIPVDFFAATEMNWWCLLVCRTGSKENNEAICNAAIKKGLKWQPYGAGFADRVTGELLRRVRSEREVFEAVGLPYKEPWER